MVQGAQPKEEAITALAGQKAPPPTTHTPLFQAMLVDPLAPAGLVIVPPVLALHSWGGLGL